MPYKIKYRTKMYEWRKQNEQEYREYLANYYNKYNQEKYNSNEQFREERLLYAKKWYKYRTECQRLRNILIDT